ncbi:MAG TPA: two-component sensor histidine kinase, partial [Pseudomonas sp.]|nr:two-component sensor histidine kinase [Pseudomonas sp.]
QPEDREAALQQLLTGVDRTTRVVTQLLTLARLEPNAQPRHPQQLDLLPLCRECLAELTPLALARDQELTLEADDVADHRLPGDAAALATLLQNLVGNALQYTPDGGQIQVSLQTMEDGVSLCVDDSGPGVPAAQRDKLFERFYRQGDGQGAGLGLAIVARIAELHGATIELADSPLGGLQVAVHLPRQPHH